MLERWLFPPVCLGCHRLLATQSATCERCALDLVPIEPRWRVRDGVEALYEYEGPLATAARQLKYGGQTAWAGPLGRLLRQATWMQPEVLARVDFVVPVPLHWRRLLARGFNQAERIAHFALPTALRPKICPRMLRRTRATAPQTRLGALERLDNVADAFVVPRARVPPLADRTVLLVDDVVTTGATLDACRMALERAGVATVHALALLRAANVA